MVLHWNRGDYPPAKEYLSFSEKQSSNLVEAFKNMQLDEEEDLHIENGDSAHEVCFLAAGKWLRTLSVLNRNIFRMRNGNVCWLTNLFFTREEIFVG